MRHAFLLLCIVVLITFGGCNKSTINLEDLQKFRTVLVYIAANNSLENEAYKNMDQMEASIGQIDGNLIVYVRLPFSSPKLYHISKEGGRKEVKSFAAHNSSDPATMAQVIQDTKALYPAKTYGLVLWSHATGWIPMGAGTVKLRSFGDDNASQMDVKELNAAISGDFDFIMFDACSMASLEVLYEIKDKAKHFIVSPGEMVANGMPYDKITNDLFSKDPDSYTHIAKKYHEHYNSMTGLYRSATISVIDAAKLDALAQATEQIITSQEPIHVHYNRDLVQRMDFDPEGNPLIAFDFQDFMEQNYGTSPQYPALVDAIEDMVIYKANTPQFNGVEIKTNSGVTCYIPHEDNEQRVHGYYRTLKWYKNSGFDKLL